MVLVLLFKVHLIVSDILISDFTRLERKNYFFFRTVSDCLFFERCKTVFEFHSVTKLEFYLLIIPG